MEKQIKKMTTDLCESLTWTDLNGELMLDPDQTCETLYKKGYRKQEDIVAEIFGEIEKLLDRHSNAQCYQGEVFVDKWFDGELEEAVAALKKKFQNDNKNLLHMEFSSTRALRNWLEMNLQECGSHEEYDEWLERFFVDGNTIFVGNEEWSYQNCFDIIL